MIVIVIVGLFAAPIFAIGPISPPGAPAGSIGPSSHPAVLSAWPPVPHERPMLSAPSASPSIGHPPSLAPRASAVVNPKSSYSTEPAPMGIADFGVTGTGSGAQGYEYSTSSFEATAVIDAMSVTIPGGGSGDTTTAFELNAMVVLDAGGVNYTYWIQNGLHFAAATHEFTIGGAYVWNFSGTTAGLTASEVRGAPGSAISSGVFIYLPGCNGLPGQCSTVTLPATLAGRISVAVVSGQPVVSYAYDLGAGWVTYDQVTFLHLTGASVTGFVVNGFRGTPRGGFYDAEWDWVAAGGGLSSVDQNSYIAMSLDLWNGHNYQAVPGAWDFGGDTGETSSNISVAYAAPASTGSPEAVLTSGAGSLGPLYGPGAHGSLNVSLPTVPNGTLLLDGSPVPYQGGSANLTLGAGSYSVALQNYSNASARVSIVAGSTATLDLSGAGRTTIGEIGLPSGTRWGATVGGLVRTGSTTSLSFTLANGTYPVLYQNVAGYVRTSGDPPSITVPVASAWVVQWAPYEFDVPITEAGLPPGTSWWVNVSGVVVQATTSQLDVRAPNGSTPFTAGSVYEFVADPANGSIEVDGGLVAPVQVQFTYRSTWIAGTVRPADAQVTLDGNPLTVHDGAFSDLVRPGVYNLTASASGYESRTVRVVATAGNTTTEAINLTRPSSNGPSPSNTTSSNALLSPLVLGAGAVVVVAAVLVALLGRRRRSRSP